MSELPPRPHRTPCACPECAEWAKAIVATPTERRYDPQTSPPAVDMPLAEFSRSIIAIACKATGMTEERLREEAAKLTREDTPAPSQPPGPTREQVAGRMVPEIHIASVYDKEPQSCDALAAVRTFLKSDRTMLVLSGGVGLRKTGSACWALTQKPGTFIVADDMIRCSASRDPDDVTMWRRCRGTQLLVVDDLGGEYVDDKGFRIAQVNGLVDYRYGHKLKTIITTNLDWATFASTYRDRVADRIKESGRWVNLGGESIRRRA